MSNLQKIIIITAPSGSGKSTLVKRLLDAMPELSFSVSACTRSPRGNEQHGVEYYFISVEEFKQHIQQDNFIEWEMVYEGKYYGTLKAELKRIWALNRIPVLDIDVKGAIHVQQQYPENTLSIFIEPPSIEELRNRLLSRGTENEESLQARVNKASYEISFKEHFDRIIINESLEKACNQAEKVVEAFLEL